MTSVLDTNVLVRHLIGTPPDQARRATKLLEDGAGLVLLSAVLAEVVFVLESNYSLPREGVALGALSLLALPSIVAPEGRALIDALQLYLSTRIHFVDAYVAAVARRTNVGRVTSFDRRLDCVEGIERVEP